MSSAPPSIRSLYESTLELAESLYEQLMIEDFFPLERPKTNLAFGYIESDLSTIIIGLHKLFFVDSPISLLTVYKSITRNIINTFFTTGCSETIITLGRGLEASLSRLILGLRMMLDPLVIKKLSNLF